MQNMSNLWESAICNEYALKYANMICEQKYDKHNMHSPLCWWSKLHLQYWRCNFDIPPRSFFQVEMRSAPVWFTAVKISIQLKWDLSAQPPLQLSLTLSILFISYSTSSWCLTSTILFDCRRKLMGDIHLRRGIVHPTSGAQAAIEEEKRSCVPIITISGATLHYIWCNQSLRVLFTLLTWIAPWMLMLSGGGRRNRNCIKGPMQTYFNASQKVRYKLQELRHWSQHSSRSWEMM